jgi:transcriptional regulator with XRE-family HTH domain
MKKDSEVYVLGANLKYYRELKGNGITQDDLADLIGKSRPTYNVWEQREKVKMSLKDAQLIAERLGVTVDDLTHVLTQEPLNGNSNIVNNRETFYLDLIEGNEEYSILPKAILKDYKIVPDKIIDVIIQSNENERKAIEKSKTLEIEGLNRKYEIIIEGYENKIKKLEKENEDLRGGKIPPKQ